MVSYVVELIKQCWTKMLLKTFIFIFISYTSPILSVMIQIEMIEEENFGYDWWLSVWYSKSFLLYHIPSVSSKLLNRFMVRNVHSLSIFEMSSSFRQCFKLLSEMRTKLWLRKSLFTWIWRIIQPYEFFVEPIKKVEQNSTEIRSFTSWFFSMYLLCEAARHLS